MIEPHELSEICYNKVEVIVRIMYSVSNSVKKFALQLYLFSQTKQKDTSKDQNFEESWENKMS